MNEIENISLRDYFAAKAMQGLLSNDYMVKGAVHRPSQEWIKGISETAYEFADAMLAEREPFAIKEAMRWGINGNREHKE